MHLRDLQLHYASLRPGDIEKTEWLSMFYWLTEAYSGLDRMAVTLHRDDVLEAATVALYKQAFDRLSAGEPIQYVVQRAFFKDRWFKVDHNTLIPRPETEELVDAILREASGAMSALDIGTGSGCIAITLALEMPQCHIEAIDVSGEALAVAQDNAAQLGAELVWHQMDILNDKPEGSFDLIVSNPPYVTRSESEQMRRNVLEHEPHLALFVPDADPLRFYRRIAQISKQALNPGGWLYFEINEYLGNEVVSLLEEMGFGEPELLEDFLGKHRFVRCKQHE